MEEQQEQQRQRQQQQNNPTSTMMNINDLDDDPLLLFFRRLTLQELLRHRLVCSRWKLLIEQLTTGRRSLKLFSAFANVYQYANDLVNFGLDRAEHLALRPEPPEDDDLVLALKSPEVARLLDHLFPNLERLVVHLDADSAAHLPTLLHSLADRLVGLSLFGEIITDHASQQQLLVALGGLRQLKHLELLSGPNYTTNRALVLDSAQFGPIVGRLESFAVSGFQLELVTLLGAAAEGQRLQRLTLDRLPLAELRQLLDLSGQTAGSLAKTLTHLSVDDLTLDALQLICEHFAHLQSLEIELDDVKIHDIARALQRLPRLTALQFKTFGVDKIAQMAVQGGGARDQAPPLPLPPPLPPLPTIKWVTILKLNLFAQSTSGPNYLVQTLAGLFPQAEAIYLRNETPLHTPALLAGMLTLSRAEREYLERRVRFYATATMLHAGRHAERCRLEKRRRQERMWDYEGAGGAAAAGANNGDGHHHRFDHNARLGRLAIGQAIQARIRRDSQ